ncbi:MAG: FAD-binding protein [Desulfobacterota bacterium]|jgi:glycolate oxidase|nr:FAD-binding protein [Thermodesulfobacteriota bacterium]
MDERIKQSLKEIVGPDHFSDRLIDLVSYSYDASDHNHRPEAAVWPLHSEEVSRIMRLAYDNALPVIPRGAGTGLAGGAVPVRGGLVLDLCRMNKIVAIRIADRSVVVQPGVVYADLENALAPYGFFFPPDPASGKACTLGGNVATNAGGIRGAKYGVTRDYVMGLEVVLADGQIMRTGTACMKSSSGYDLTRLFVGSEGTLGILTEITLKVSPKPLCHKTALGMFSSLRDAGQAVSDIMHSGIIPSVLEIMDANSIRVLREIASFPLPDAAAVILTETDGYTKEETEFQMARILDIFRTNGATQIQEAASAADAEKLWKLRKSVGSAAAKLRTNNISEDVAIPISRLPDLLSGISALVEKHGLPFVIFGHAGDGNIHPRIMYDQAEPDQRRKVREVAEEIFKLSCSLGGTLTGEHGVGIAKAPFMPLEHDRAALAMMRSLKRLIDPRNILNPGKMGLDDESRIEQRATS